MDVEVVHEIMSGLFFMMLIVMIGLVVIFAGKSY